MNDQEKSKAQLISELVELRQCVTELELSDTKRKRAEAALRESEKRYRMLFEKAGDAIFILEAEGAEAGKIVAANQAAAEMHDYTVDELLSLNIKNLDTPDVAKQVPARIQRMLAGEWLKEEITHRKKDGTVFPVEISAGLLELGDHKYILAFDRDISERKRIEGELRESEKKYRDLFETAMVGLYRSRIEDGKVLAANQACADVFGYDSADQMVAECIASQHYANPELREELLQQLAAQGKVDGFEILATRRDGSHGNIALSATIYPERGYLEGVLIDITERKRAEEALRESEEKYSGLFHHSNDAIFVHDLEGNFLDVNQKALDQFGHSKSEILSIKVPDLHPPEALEKSRSAFETITQKGFVNFETVFKKNTGELFDAEVSSSLFEIEGKKVIQGIVRDITERRRAEEALRESVENFKSLARNANDGILIAAGEEGVSVYANRRASEITGYSVDELLEIGLHEVVAPDEVEEVADRYKRRLAGENVPGQYETALVKKSGKIFPVELSSARTVWKGLPASIVIIHDITERKQAEEVLLKREAALKIQTDELEEVNTALRVLLKRREEDKTELEEKILSNVKELVAPCLERLRNTGLNAKQAAHVETLESNLTDIISPFAHRLSSKYLNLTPTEIQIADLIKEGRTTKEIAELLNSSSRTIEFHRNNIRKKIGIVNRKTNLRSHLLAM
jgi:PAS domain S-box-containing protein